MSDSPGWYAVMLGADLDPGTSAGTRLFGQELVVWRDAAGAAHVWEDRCPHRGMRLSFGFVRGDHIACLYHGWQFDAGGQCRFIPAHPSLEVSSMIRARRFACAERGGLVWVRWDAAQETMPDLPPESPPESMPEPDVAPVPVRSLYAERPADALAAAFGGTPGRDGCLRAHLADVPVRVAVQPLAAGESAAHILIEGGEARLAARVAVASSALRRILEAGSTASAPTEGAIP